MKQVMLKGFIVYISSCIAFKFVIYCSCVHVCSKNYIRKCLPECVLFMCDSTCVQKLTMGDVLITLHLAYLGRVSQLNPELTDRVSPTSQLVFIFLSAGIKCMPPQPPRIQIQTPISCWMVNTLTTKPSPQYVVLKNNYQLQTVNQSC